MPALAAAAALALAEAACAAPRPAYLARGDEVEALHGELTARLASAHQRLRRALDAHAPDLLSALDPEPPSPLARGYQLLPRLTGDPPPAARGAAPAPRLYSWPRTREMIAGTERGVATLLARLQALPAGVDARGALAELIETYRRLDTGRRTEGEHVRYNRLWQDAIARDPARFEGESRLLAGALELRAVERELESSPSGEPSPRLAQRARSLAERLDAHRRRRAPCPFLRVERPAEGLWIVGVPVYTDIEDAAFLASAEEAIESVWRVAEDGAEYRVDLELRRLEPEALYAPSAPPARGADVDVAAHVARFPRDGGVVTTGAVSTHVAANRAIVLGPELIARSVLAHEFGHVLGFRDGYLRGSRDLGSDGYEVSELVLDPADLMSNPARGKVLRAHFEVLLAGLETSCRSIPALPSGRQGVIPVRRVRAARAQARFGRGLQRTIVQGSGVRTAATSP